MRKRFASRSIPSLEQLAFLGRKLDANGKLEPRSKPKRKRTVSASIFAKTTRETEHMIETREWDDAAPRHLVALYEIMHCKIYGASASLSSSELHIAVIKMRAFVKRAFEEDCIEAVNYFRWLWTRERERERWARENNIERHSRLSLGLTISGTMLADYRVDRARRARQGSGSRSS